MKSARYLGSVIDGRCGWLRQPSRAQPGGFMQPSPGRATPHSLTAAQDHRHHDDPHRPQSDPAGHRQGLDQRAGPLRPGLCDVHPAGPRGADGRREVPEAVPDRPRRRPDRGHLAVVLRQLVLAERPGAVQRHERRRHGALGHQGQAGEHARLSTAGRQVPVRRGALCSRPRPRRQGGRGRSAAQAMAKGYRHIRVQVAIPGLATYGTAPARRSEPAAARSRAARPNPKRSGSRARTCARVPKLFEHLRCTARRRRRAAPRRPRADLAQPGGQASARSWRSITCSSSKTRCRPRRKTTSG